MARHGEGGRERERGREKVKKQIEGEKRREDNIENAEKCSM